MNVRRRYFGQLRLKSIRPAGFRCDGCSTYASFGLDNSLKTAESMHADSVGQRTFGLDGLQVTSKTCPKVIFQLPRATSIR